MGRASPSTPSLSLVFAVKDPSLKENSMCKRVIAFQFGLQLYTSSDDVFVKMCKAMNIASHGGICTKQNTRVYEVKLNKVLNDEWNGLIVS